MSIISSALVLLFTDSTTCVMTIVVLLEVQNIAPMPDRQVWRHNFVGVKFQFPDIERTRFPEESQRMGVSNPCLWHFFGISLVHTLRQLDRSIVVLYEGLLLRCVQLSKQPSLI